jgi:hypothetical protein
MITAHDLMDVDGVATAFGVTRSSLHVALSKPEVDAALATRLPDPLRRSAGHGFGRGPT